MGLCSLDSQHRQMTVQKAARRQGLAGFRLYGWGEVLLFALCWESPRSECGDGSGFRLGLAEG